MIAEKQFLVVVKNFNQLHIYFYDKKLRFDSTMQITDILTVPLYIKFNNTDLTRLNLVILFIILMKYTTKIWIIYKEIF